MHKKKGGKNREKARKRRPLSRKERRSLLLLPWGLHLSKLLRYPGLNSDMSLTING